MFRRFRMSHRHLASLLLSAVLAGGLIACGGDDDNESAGSGDKTGAVEKAFLTGMVAHHEAAIEMAEVAEQRGQDPFIKELAVDITSSQQREIAGMRQIYRRLFDAELKPDPGAHDGLGLTAEEAGMAHSRQTMEMLRSANPFDRAFVDEMVPHHEGAVKMANVVLRTTKDAPLRKLAEGIVSAQEREIEEMNDFRTKRFGGPVPARKGMESGGKMPGGKKEHHPG